MQYLLDTNAWIGYLKKPGSRIQSRLSAVSPSEVVTCSIVLSELLHGAEKYGNRSQRIATVRALLAPFLCVPFDDLDASQYAILYVRLLRGSLAFFSCMMDLMYPSLDTEERLLFVRRWNCLTDHL